MENNSKLDITQPHNLALVQRALEKTIESQARDALTLIQKRYQVDSVGFGQYIYRHKPKKWNGLKDDWDRQFPQVETSIEVKLTVDSAGLAGAPLQFEEQELKE